MGSRRQSADHPPRLGPSSLGRGTRRSERRQQGHAPWLASAWPDPQSRRPCALTRRSGAAPPRATTFRDGTPSDAVSVPRLKPVVSLAHELNLLLTQRSPCLPPPSPGHHPPRPPSSPSEPALSAWGGAHLLPAQARAESRGGTGAGRLAFGKIQKEYDVCPTANRPPTHQPPSPRPAHLVGTPGLPEPSSASLSSVPELERRHY